MVYRVFCIFIVMSLILSCQRHFDLSDRDYKGEPNYEEFYVVDTIKIVDPVRVYSVKYGGYFIVSKAILKDYNGKDDFFYRPDVFLYGDDLYGDLPLKKLKKYKYHDYGGCSFGKWQQKDSDLNFQELSPTPRTFILGLINANYFYNKHIGFDGHQFTYHKEHNAVAYNKVIYYKIVYPFCD